MNTTIDQTTTDELTTRLSIMQRRRSELATDAELSRRELDSARSALVEGSGTAASVTAAQSRYSALTEALSDLDSRIGALTSQLDQMRASEQNRERVSTAAAAATEFAATQKLLASQYEKMVADLQRQHAAIFETAQKMNAAAQKAREALATVNLQEVLQIAPALAIQNRNGSNVLDVIAARQPLDILVQITLPKVSHTQPMELKAHESLLEFIERQLRQR